MPKVSYDPETKILSIRISNNKSADSSIKQNCVFDYDSKGNMVNIDVLEFNLETILTNKKK